MDAIALLQQDHVDARKAMEEIGYSAAPNKKKLFADLKNQVEMHDIIEKNIFYPAMQADSRTKALPAWDKAAHAAVDKSMKELSELDPEDKGWTAAFNDLRGHLLKHVQAEEIGLFIQVRQIMSSTELNGIGHKMTTERERLVKSL